MLRDDDDVDTTVFPEITCEVCGKQGGGNPKGGVDNVVVFYEMQLCGHHALELEESMGAAILRHPAEWLEKKKGKAA